MPVLTTTLIVLLGLDAVVGPKEFSTREDCSTAASMIVSVTDHRDGVKAICFDALGRVLSATARSKVPDR